MPTGCNLTWTQISTVTMLLGVNRMTVFVGVGTAPSAGAVTVGFGGVTQTKATWVIDSFQNGDGSAAGANFAVQSVSGTTDAAATTSMTATMAAFGSAANASYGVVGHNTNGSSTAGTGFTELADQFGIGKKSLATEWRNNNDTTIDYTIPSSLGAMIIGIELRALTLPNHTLSLGLTSGLTVGIST